MATIYKTKTLKISYSFLGNMCFISLKSKFVCAHVCPLTQPEKRMLHSFWHSCQRNYLSSSRYSVVIRGETSDDKVGTMKYVDNLLHREWTLKEATSQIQVMKIHKVGGPAVTPLQHFPSRTDQKTDPSASEFILIRDDLLHPLMGGNKLRKLDGLIPELLQQGVTDVLTCGGVQSHHTTALAVCCSERGLRAHCLLRGEPLDVPTGYNLMTHMHSEVTYVSRAEYSDREAMLQRHKQRLQDAMPSGKVAVIQEGARNGGAVWGLIRLVHWMAGSCALGPTSPRKIVVDSGTGTTAAGLAIGVKLMGLPWEVVGVMLAGAEEDYEEYTKQLLEAARECGVPAPDLNSLPLTWVHRDRPRRFGKVFPREIEECLRIAKATGIPLDPIYTLAAWQVASRLAIQDEAHYSSNENEDRESAQVVLLHTGGTMGLFGLAQRFPKAFTQ